MIAWVGRLGAATRRTGLRYLAWERRHLIAFAVGISCSSLLFITAVNMWHFAPRWLVGIVGAYGIVACMDVVYRITMDPANRGKWSAWATLIASTVVAAAGMWVLIFRTMPAVVDRVIHPAVVWAQGHAMLFVPVALLLGIGGAFREEMRAKGATWAGLVETLRGVRAARRADREARRGR